MQFSLCTGGAFVNATLAFRNFVASHDSAQNSVPMTFANIGYLTCHSSGKVADENISHNQASGCQNASSCLSREHTRIRDQQISQIFSHDLFVIASYFNDSYTEFAPGSPSYVLLRPPGELAFQGLHSTVKLD